MPFQKYKTDSNVRILGVALIPITTNRRLADYSDLVLKYGFENIDPDRWYVFQDELDFMHELSQRPNGTENMVAIGIDIFEGLVLPPEIKTLEQGIQMLNDIVHLNMRNVPDGMGYTIKPVKPKHVRVTEDIPFPHDLIYSYLYGLSKKLLPSGHDFTIEREFVNARNPDMAGATYDIQWD